MKTKYFYVRVELGECIPSYDFCLKAKTFEKAKELATEIITEDYPEQSEYADYFLIEITAEQLLKRMTLN